MDLDQFIAWAQRFSDLGWSVQDQFRRFISGEEDDLNPNAVREIKAFIKDLHKNFPEIDTYGYEED